MASAVSMVEQRCSELQHRVEDFLRKVRAG
jgi:hypothetical protein